MQHCNSKVTLDKTQSAMTGNQWSNIRAGSAVVTPSSSRGRFLYLIHPSFYLFFGYLLFFICTYITGYTHTHPYTHKMYSREASGDQRGSPMINNSLRSPNFPNDWEDCVYISETPEHAAHPCCCARWKFQLVCVFQPWNTQTCTLARQRSSELQSQAESNKHIKKDVLYWKDDFVPRKYQPISL